MIKASFFHKKVYSFGIYHAGYSLFDSILLQNLEDAPLSYLKISVKTIPNVILHAECEIPFLAPEGFSVISGDFIQPAPEKLVSLREITMVRVLLSVSDQEGQTLYSSESSLTLLPYDHFAGYLTYAESLAFFVTPNQPEVQEISATLKGLNTNNAVHTLYNGIKEKKLTYAAENYFDSAPCRLRLPELILQRRGGNALELCVLFSSVMEALGKSCVLISTPKGKSFVGIETESHQNPMVTVMTKQRKNLDGYLFLDGSYLAYGSELSYDNAIYRSKHFLEMTDEKLIMVDLAAARKMHLIPLPNRVWEESGSVLSAAREGESSGNFSEYLALMQRYSSDSRITSVLTGKKLYITTAKNAPLFDADLDVNQNKLLNKILNSDFTLIRAQHGTGATTLFSHAAFYALKSKKNVLYIPDEGYNSADFANTCASFFDPAFVLDLTSRSYSSVRNVKEEEFNGIFEEHQNIFDEKDAIRTSFEEMDRYYAALEGSKGITSSFLAASDRYHQFRDASASLVFSPEQIGLLNEKMAQQWFATLSEALKCAEEAGGVFENPLEFIRQKDFSYELKSKLISQLENLLHSVELIIDLRDRVLSRLASPIKLNSVARLQAFCDLTKIFLEFESIPTAFFENQPEIEENFQKLTKLIQAKIENEQIEEIISISFEPTIFELPAEENHSRWKELSGDKSLKGMSQRYSLQKNIKRYLRPNCDVKNIEYVLSRLAAYQRNLVLIEETTPLALHLTDVDVSVGEEEREHLKEIADLCYQGYVIFAANFPNENIGILISDIASYLKDEDFVSSCRELRNRYEDFISNKQSFEWTALNDLDRYSSRFMTESDDYFSCLYAELTKIFAAMNRLNSWCAWLFQRDACLHIGLKNVVLALETGSILPQDMKKAFLRAFFKGICEYNFISHPELVPGKFDFEEKKEIIRQAKGRLLAFQKAELDSMLSIEKLNARNELPQNRDLQDLIENDPQSFCAIYPCVIADMKTAKELFAEKIGLFDLILVEKRQKIDLADFVWCFAASKHLAFAGHFSQGYQSSAREIDLSGSAFDYLWQIAEKKYSLSAVYENSPAITAVKSALCRADRSDSRCYTVPDSAKSKALQLISVRGFFDQEVPLANMPEAEAIVDALIQNADILSEKSVSVIAATKEQKEAIVRLLAQKLYQQNSLAEKMLGSEKHLFLSSLEEEIHSADIVYFSTVFAVDRSTYGSRLPHLFSQSFGTLPKAQLSAVVSAAREKIHIVTSFSSEDLSYSPSIINADSSFALFYQLALAPASNSSYIAGTSPVGSSFVKRLESELVQQGYCVESGVQSGRYYIDLAVKDKSGNFVLGIISDQSVMNQKAHISAIEMQNEAAFSKCGWQIYRLRSTDCFDRFERELDHILAILNPPAEEIDWI